MPNSKMNVIIVGSEGFIGSSLQKKLNLNPDLFPIGIDIIEQKKENDSLFILSDLNNPQLQSQIEQKIKKEDPIVFIHLAGLANLKTCEENPDLAHKLNVTLTQETLRLAKSLNAQKFIFLSSGTLYGDNSSEKKTENSPILSDHIYGKTKLLAEKEIEFFCSANNMTFFNCRLSNVYGYRMTKFAVIGKLIEQAKNNELIMPMFLSPKRDFIHVDDVASALIEMTKNEDLVSGTYNISTGLGISIGEVTNHIRQLIHQELIDLKTVKKAQSTLILDNSKLVSNSKWTPKLNIVKGLEDILKKEGII